MYTETGARGAHTSKEESGRFDRRCYILGMFSLSTEFQRASQDTHTRLMLRIGRKVNPDGGV